MASELTTAKSRGKSNTRRSAIRAGAAVSAVAISMLAGTAHAWVAEQGTSDPQYDNNSALNTSINGGRAIGTLHAIAVGTGSEANNYSIAMGSAQATGEYAIAMGLNATATADRAIAMGNGASATALFAVATGAVAQANGIQSYAGGFGAGAYNHSSIAIGARSSAGVSGSATGDPATDPNHATIAIGDSSSSIGSRSTALGANAAANGTGSLALGTDTIALGVNSIAVGNSANASDTSVALGANAVASRLHGVALGDNSIADRVGMSGAAEAFSGATVVSDYGAVAIGKAGSERQITHVAGGTQETDAVNVRQLQAVKDGALNYERNPDGTLNTSSVTLQGLVYDPATQLGGTQITNVARGVADSDAVNMSQLNETNTQVANITNNINGLADGALLWDAAANGGVGAFSASRSGTGPSKITHVANGDLSATSTDAVNGSQLSALGDRVTDINGRVTTIENNFNNIGNSGSNKYFQANSTGADSVASGADALAIGAGAKASGAGSMAMGEGALSSADGSVALGKGASDGGRGAENYAGKYSGADNATSGTVSVGNVATGETRTISNVADGKEDTDAVNMRQLDGAVAESKKYTDDSINKITNGVTSGTDGMFQVNNSSNLAKPQATGKDSVAGGAGSKASGSNSTALGSNSNASGDNSVALGANSVADRANSVSVGAAGSERQITNVAAGVADTDAVNVSQLNSGLADVTKSANAYTRDIYNALNKDIKDLDDALSAGIAGAMAMAALPQPYAPGASMTSGGLSTYRGQSAMALGVSRISDNGRWVAKMQATANTQRELGASVGVGYQW